MKAKRITVAAHERAMPMRAPPAHDMPMPPAPMPPDMGGADMGMGDMSAPQRPPAVFREHAQRTKPYV